MTIDLVFVTYNRLEYTKLALASVLSDPTEEFSLTIWDNASTDGTVEYLRSEVSDPRIKDIVFSKENVGQLAAINEIWSQSKADLLGKLDNDCILSPGWTRKLAQAHADIDKLGVVACWHFFEDDFDYDRAKHKIQEFNGHKIFRHPWTCGTGLLIKRSSYERFGPFIEKNVGTTGYWMKMARAGMINGFYYPLVYQEHMDDPKSEHCMLKDDESLMRMKEITCVLCNNNITTMKERWARREMVLKNLLDDSWEVKHYVGWRGKLRRLRSRFSR